MSGKLVALIAMVAVLSLVACAPSEPEQTASAPETAAPAPEPMAEPAEGGPDPTVVASNLYTAELENDRVRILRIAYGAGEESVMHHHPDSVAVFLTDVDVQMTLPDGSTEELIANAGDAIFAPAGQHQPKNLTDAPLELVQVELKSGGPTQADEGGADPTVVDADHYTAEFENDRVRIVRIAYDAGEESVMHYHPDSVAVFVTDHLVQMTMPDGSTEELTANAGDAMFIPAGQHLPKNISDGPWELVLVELK